MVVSTMTTTPIPKTQLELDAAIALSRRGLTPLEQSGVLDALVDVGSEGFDILDPAEQQRVDAVIAQAQLAEAERLKAAAEKQSRTAHKPSGDPAGIPRQQVEPAATEEAFAANRHRLLNGDTGETSPSSSEYVRLPLRMPFLWIFVLCCVCLVGAGVFGTLYGNQVAAEYRDEFETFVLIMKVLLITAAAMAVIGVAYVILTWPPMMAFLTFVGRVLESIFNAIGAILGFMGKVIEKVFEEQPRKKSGKSGGGFGGFPILAWILFPPILLFVAALYLFTGWVEGGTKAR